MAKDTQENTSRLGDLELLVRDRPEALVRRLSLSPHRKARGSAGEGWGRFLQVSVFGTLLALVPWVISAWLFTRVPNVDVWLALLPWVVILGATRGGRWDPNDLRPSSHVNDGFLEQHIMSRIAPYLREESLASVYTSSQAPGLTAAFHGKTLEGGSLTLRFDVRSASTRLIIRISELPVHPVLSEIESIALPKVSARSLTCGGLELDLQGPLDDWWGALPELRSGEITHDPVAYVTGFLLSRMSLRSRSFDRVISEISAQATTRLTPPSPHADLLHPPSTLRIAWIARTVIPSSNPDEEELEDFLDFGTSIYHRSGILLLLLVLLSHAFVFLLAQGHGVTGWFLHAGYWWIILCVVMTGWHQGISDLPYGRVTPYSAQRALDARGELSLDATTLRSGQGEIDLLKFFSVSFSREMYNEQPILNVSIRQTKADGAVSRVEFSTHIEPDQRWNDLPLYTSASPLLTPHRDVEDLWRVLDHYTRAHGQTLPWILRVSMRDTPCLEEDTEAFSPKACASSVHFSRHTVSRTS